MNALAEQAAEMWTMAMHEAGFPSLSAYATGIAYEDDPENSVAFGYPDGYTPGTPEAEASERAWTLVRVALEETRTP